MFDWFDFDEFKPMTGRVYTKDSELINRLADEARALIEGWSDQKVEGVSRLFLNECESYVQCVISEGEAIRTLVIGAGEELINSEALEDINYNAEMVEFDVAGNYIEWPIYHQVEECLLLDIVNEWEVYQFIASKDTPVCFDWMASKKLQSYSAQELLACLSLQVIATYDHILKYPNLSRSWLVDEEIPFHLATCQQQLHGTEEAMSYALLATQLLATAKEQQCGKVQEEVKKKSRDRKKERIEVARKGGKAKAKKYDPLKKFVYDYYHSVQETRPQTVVKEMIDEFTEFCKENEYRYLAPSNYVRQLSDWLSQHKKTCSICQDKETRHTSA